jgi:pyridoxine 5-phosphate synthase
MAAKLSVNMNAVAMLRNRRNLPWPSLEKLGQIALQAGAVGLTVHPRPDQRHIRFSDVPTLRKLTQVHQAEFNMEGYPSPEFLELVSTHRPDQVTLVPDDPGQSTSDHGCDFVSFHTTLSPLVADLKQLGMRVSLFCDPDAGNEQIAAARSTGADRIELYTGPYGGTYDNAKAAKIELEKLIRTAAQASQAGLGINAGHDLTVENLPLLVRAIRDIAEVSIGHALTADALQFGMAETVRRYIQACAG